MGDSMQIGAWSMQLKRYNDKKEEIPVAYFFFF